MYIESRPTGSRVAVVSRYASIAFPGALGNVHGRRGCRDGPSRDPVGPASRIGVSSTAAISTS
ncbi:MAG: hypothetical protein ACQET5_07920 [Halobacteriota archaeon]|uniref:hypothetical protein n=1 Tax=Natronomonas sp. TaxID=2184060 RepID=UPI0039754E62